MVNFTLEYNMVLILIILSYLVPYYNINVIVLQFIQIKSYYNDPISSLLLMIYLKVMMLKLLIILANLSNQIILLLINVILIVIIHQ